MQTMLIGVCSCLPVCQCFGLWLCLVPSALLNPVQAKWVVSVQQPSEADISAAFAVFAEGTLGSCVGDLPQVCAGYENQHLLLLIVGSTTAVANGLHWHV
jgi:hypothetical protein